MRPEPETRTIKRFYFKKEGYNKVELQQVGTVQASEAELNVQIGKQATGDIEVGDNEAGDNEAGDE